MAAFTALYDACVLYPAPLRDLLVRLARTGLFRARWTDRIHDEWIRNVLENRPELQPEKLQRTRELMNDSVLDCLVTDYEDLIESLELPDPDDRHVLAAAIRGRADVIVTYNLRDFPPNVLDRYDLDAQHPDEFVTYLLDLRPAVVYQAVREQRQALKNPARTAQELLATLEQQQLVQTVIRLSDAVTLL